MSRKAASRVALHGFFFLRCDGDGITIGATVVVFALSLGGMGLVQQQFFPASDRAELIIDWSLPQNSTIGRNKQADDRV